MILLYGEAYWREILNFDALVKYGMIAKEDMNLFSFADTPEDAMRVLKNGLTKYYLEPEAHLPRVAEEGPEIAKSRTS